MKIDTVEVHCSHCDGIAMALVRLGIIIMKLYIV